MSPAIMFAALQTTVNASRGFSICAKFFYPLVEFLFNWSSNWSCARDFAPR